MIRNGKLIKEFTIDELKHSKLKTYKVELKNDNDVQNLKLKFPDAKFKEAEKQMIISINDKEINTLIGELSKCDINFLKEEKHTLEEYFMQFYGGNDNV